jgi:hypothetical protein
MIRARLNYFEAFAIAHVPQLGNWRPKDAGNGSFESVHSIFIPNALFLRNLATELALWQFDRARWTKNRLWRELEDLSMLEIYEKRFGPQLPDARAD